MRRTRPVALDIKAANAMRNLLLNQVVYRPVWESAAFDALSF